MKRFRRRHLRSHLAILAMIGLLWSQLVLAGHPGCSMAFMALAELEVATAAASGEAGHSCHQDATSTEDAVCAAHCGQGSLTNEVGRLPAVPALPAAEPIAVTLFVFLRADPARHHALPPPISWNRPTAHPAALLLI